jgi:prepilin-type processing-associated H-X9-DG protein
VDGFTQGRTLGTLEAPYSGTNLLYAGQLADREEIDNANYSHSTFVNVSFLDGHIRSGKFRNCVFIECYFRRANIRNSTFVGCKFINCTFSHATIRTSDFRYADFRGSHPPYAELRYTAPSEPNLRAELFSRISSAAFASGDLAEARRYRLAALDAHKEHLKAALTSTSTWYSEHYPLSKKILAASSLFWHYLNRLLWRHGESAWRLLVSTLLLSIGILPCLYWLFGNDFSRPVDGFVDAIWLSLSNFLSIDRLSDRVPSSATTRALCAIEALSGVIFGGLFVTVLVKALLRR